MIIFWMKTYFENQSKRMYDKSHHKFYNDIDKSLCSYEGNCSIINMRTSVWTRTGSNSDTPFKVEQKKGLKQNASVHYRPGYKCDNQFTIFKMSSKASFQIRIFVGRSGRGSQGRDGRFWNGARKSNNLSFEIIWKTNETFWYLGTYLPRLSSEKIRFITKIKGDQDSDW